jgi:ankyrin repeat protein
MLVEEKRVDLAQTELEGETVLHRAATLKGSEATVVLKLLIELGADVNGRTVIGDTPLFAASAAGSLQSTKVSSSYRFM